MTDATPIDDDIRRELNETFRNAGDDRKVTHPGDMAALAHTDRWLRQHRPDRDLDNMAGPGRTLFATLAALVHAEGFADLEALAGITCRRCVPFVRRMV